MGSLKGFFSFVYYDSKEHSILFARDCFGVKPLYFSIINNKYPAFSSTSEALDWIKLLLLEDLSPSDLKIDGKNLLPKLHGALLKNEQDIQLFEQLAFMSRSNKWCL